MPFGQRAAKGKKKPDAKSGLNHSLRGWMRGQSRNGCRRNRTFNLRIKSPMLCQLSYTPTRRHTIHPVGFEPATLGFEVRCSIQLSYGCKGWVVGFEPTTSGTTIPRSDQLSYTHHFTQPGDFSHWLSEAVNTLTPAMCQSFFLRS